MRRGLAVWGALGIWTAACGPAGGDGLGNDGVLAGVIVGDSSDDAAAMGPEGETALLAEYQGNIDEQGRLTLTPKGAGGGLKPQGFIQLTGDASLDVANLGSCLGSYSTCTGTDGGVCAPGEVCVDVQLTNNVKVPIARPIQEVWMEIDTMVPADGSYHATNSDVPVDPTYPETIVSDAYGRWRYGDIQSGQSVARFWKLRYLGGSISFSIRAWGTYTRSWYKFSSKNGTGRPAEVDSVPFVNACEGGVRVLDKDNCDDCAATGNAPFPMTIYGITHQDFTVHSSGVFALGNHTSRKDRKRAQEPRKLDRGRVPTSALFPFWGDISTTKGNGVCYRTVGEAPNRQLQVTWSAPRLASDRPRESSLSFTTIFYEGSDNVDYLYLPTSSRRELSSRDLQSVIGVKGIGDERLELRRGAELLADADPPPPGQALRLRLLAGDPNSSGGPTAPPTGTRGQTQ